MCDRRRVQVPGVCRGTGRAGSWGGQSGRLYRCGRSLLLWHFLWFAWAVDWWELAGVVCYFWVTKYY
jgi:hypothetical protein